MSTPRPLPPEAEAQLDKHSALGRAASEAGDLDAAERHFQDAWNSIPDPKLEYDYAASMAMGLTEFFRDSGQAGKALPWLALTREAYGPDNPEIDFLAATVHYAAGEFDQAYELFDKLYQQYRRRPFQGEDPAYLDFYEARAGGRPDSPYAPQPDASGAGEDAGAPGELPDDIYEQIEALSEEGNDLIDEDDPAGAEAAWRQALDLLPEPRSDWEAYTWLCTSIGEACYFQDRYADAAQWLFDALNGPGALDNPFVHYMLGKALWQQGGNEERAVSELLSAYMLDGTDIFDADEEEGPDMLQLLLDRGLIEEE